METTNNTPTAAQSFAFSAMYDYFNRALFGGQLLPVILNFSRHANTLGFFAPDRWSREGEPTTHEISLNPSYLAARAPRLTVSTLVHEMAHCWQQEHGKPSLGGYHNEEWAAKMESIGLMPSSTAAPDGKRTGYKVSHYIIEGGAFARAFAAMPTTFLLPWVCDERTAAKAKKKPASKVKFTCPDCGANAWGRPALHVLCGDCDVEMLAEGAIATTQRQAA